MTEARRHAEPWLPRRKPARKLVCYIESRSCVSLPMPIIAPGRGRLIKTEPYGGRIVSITSLSSLVVVKSVLNETKSVRRKRIPVGLRGGRRGKGASG
jgi:hypothetical protein